MYTREKSLKGTYKVNEKEYLRLLREEHRTMWDFEEWKIFYKSLGINKKLNGLFQEDPFIFKLLLSFSYKDLIVDKNEIEFNKLKKENKIIKKINYNLRSHLKELIKKINKFEL